MAEDAGLRVANVFHAGDGNLHPLVLYDAGDSRVSPNAPGAPVHRRSWSCAWQMGGSITGRARGR